MYRHIAEYEDLYLHFLKNGEKDGVVLPAGGVQGCTWVRAPADLEDFVWAAEVGVHEGWPGWGV